MGKVSRGFERVEKASYGACFVGMFLAFPLMFLTVGDVIGSFFRQAHSRLV